MLVGLAHTKIYFLASGPFVFGSGNSSTSVKGALDGETAGCHYATRRCPVTVLVFAF